ncbi:MAG: DUF3794 domain-containing protein [Corallococcus sp.]|nr:DUF3794 domain-containing protein [Corallococcus sp.]
MANAQFENVNAIRKIDLDKIQSSQTVRISVNDQITKILTVSVDCAVLSSEAAEGEVRINGRNNVKVLYVDETGSICSANYNADFSDRMPSNDISSDSCVYLDAVVVDYKSELSGNVIIVQILTEISGSAYVRRGVTALVGGEGMFCKHVDSEITVGAQISALNGEISNELNATRPIGRVLLAESSVAIDDYSVGDGVLTVGGTALLTLTYISDEKLCSDTLPFKFSQEIDAQGVDAESQIFVRHCIKNTKIRLDVMEDQPSDTFTVDIPLTLYVLQLKSANVTLVDDAYALDCDFTFTKMPLVTCQPCGSACCLRKISSALPRSADGQFVTVTGISTVITSCDSHNGQAAIQGILRCGAIMENEGEFASTTFELPFAETVDVDFVMPDCKSAARADVTGITIKSGANVNVSAELLFTVDGEKQIQYQSIGDVAEEPFDNSLRSAIEICIAKKGETLWNVAKSLHMAEEDVLSVNPELADTLENDTKVVVYNKL